MGAGSICLCAQISLPCYIFGFKNPDLPFFECSLNLIGGTNVAFSPPYEKHACVLLPILKHSFGIDIEFNLLKRGFFPVGCNAFNFLIQSLPSLT